MRVILCALLLTACDGGRHPPKMDAPAGKDAPADARVDAPGPDAFIPPCLTGTYDVNSDWPFTSSDGPYAIAGTITFPASVPSGHFVQINTTNVTPSPGNYLKSVALTAAATSVTFRSNALQDGTFRICLKVDVDGNQSVGDVGVDYSGCYDGTTTTPIKDPSSATSIVLGGNCRSGIDFGVGTL